MVLKRIGNWTIATDYNLSHPLLVSNDCYNSLANFFQHGSSQLLSVSAESSSHPAGLDSLYAQPWVWAAGGLGNVDECPMEVCLAGGTLRDSLVFASACIVPECNAMDLMANDFPAKIELASRSRIASYEDPVLLQGYVASFQRLATINKFLKTGWVCGEYKTEWTFGTILYLLILTILLILSCIGTFRTKPRRRSVQSSTDPPPKPEMSPEMSFVRSYSIPNMSSLAQEEANSNDAEYPNFDEEKKDDTMTEELSPTPSLCSTLQRRPAELLGMPENEFWDAWDMSIHLKKLCCQRPETACLDGLKFGSILWVIYGHVIAIQSSTGPGYINPSTFLPPNGFTTTLFGQLFFSARFAVDTFLCISGYLVVHILKTKLKRQAENGATWWELLSLFLLRILRILPLYALCLGFWMFVAPHLGSGPFWYQWQFYLEPCEKYWWTNFLFVNNFLPWGRPTTDSCFYHSWYLALDVQLFMLCGPWLVLLYLRSQKAGRRMTALLWTASVVITAFLSYTRKWSVNTLDGGSAVLFDIEGYAKPHVRAQSYLAGMLVAMLPPSSSSNYQSLGGRRTAMVLALTGLTTMSLITVTGAYSRRACQFQELPSTSDCGSSWSSEATFLYTAFGRAIWSVCVATVMRLCLERKGGLVGSMLSWNIWTPLAHLSFGVYLIHPMIIFVWKLGDRQKVSFRVLSYLMDFTSITVVSFVFALLAALIVEFPCSALMRPLTRRSRPREDHNKKKEESPLVLQSIESSTLDYQNTYGTTNNLR